MRTVDFVLYRVTFHVAFGMIKRISSSVGSEYLAETFQEVSDQRAPFMDLTSQSVRKAGPLEGISLA